ncbi:MAG: protein kinase domain-containing protein, partial [Spongiibacteraceae bacterium]
MTDKSSDDDQQTEILPESATSNIDEDTTELIGDAEDQVTELLVAESVDATEILTPAASGTGNNAQPTSLEPGAILKERFYLEKKLGEGGMGAVYLARDQRKVEAKHSNPYVAVKLINGDFSQDARAFIALQRETDKSQTLAHPNIITVYDFDRDGDVFFMTMEALAGDTLETLIENQQGETSDLVSYIANVASG